MFIQHDVTSADYVSKSGTVHWTVEALFTCRLARLDEVLPKVGQQNKRTWRIKWFRDYMVGTS